MNFLNFLSRGSVEKKESAVGHSMVLNPRQPVWSPRNYKAFAEEAYKMNVTAYQCVNRIADAVASVNWCAYRGDEEIKDHPLINLLKVPNPQQSGKEFFREKVSYYMIAGNAYDEALYVRGEPKELYSLRPDRMTIVPAGNGIPEQFVYTGPSNKKVTFAAEDRTIWHMKAFNPTNDWYGLSPVEAGAFAIDQSNEAMKWLQALLQNSARPSGALTAPADSNISDDSFKRLKDEIEQRYSGSSNAGRPLLLEGGLDWKQMSLSPADMGILEIKFSAARDIALAFGVPPQLIGIPGDNTYANYSEARLSFWEDTILPLVDMIAADMTSWLGVTDGVEIRPDLEQIPAIVDKRLSLWQMADNATDLTINEKRKMKGFPPLEGGDVLLVPSGLISLGDAAAPLDTGFGKEDEKALRIVAGYEETP